MSLNLHIVTPSKNMLSTSCDDVVLPGFDGEMGVLTEHSQLVNKLGSGIVKVHTGGQTTTLAIRGGVAEVSHNQITVLADDAVYAQDVNVAKLDLEQKKLTELLVSVAGIEMDREKLFDDQKWIDAQRELVKKN